MMALRPENAADVALFPGDGALVMAKLLFAAAKLRRMQERSARAPAGRNHVVEHLVVDDELEEVAWHPRPIEVRVNTDEPPDGAVASELDRGAGLLGPGRRAAPRDECIDG